MCWVDILVTKHCFACFRQHVWSHFCLCFKDEKLTDDKATLRAFGIRDGDEVYA